MKIFVTGGAGFIGSNFVHLARQRYPNWSIHVLDLLTYAGNLENISSLLNEGVIKFHKINISDTDGVNKLFSDERPKMVFHFAAESHVDRSIHSAKAFVETNVLGTQVLIDASMKSGVERFMHVSTDEVYGSLGETGSFFETTPLDPTSPYSASKAGSDLLVLAACKTHGFKAIVTRCTNNYGPYQFPEKFIPLFITNTMEGKKLPLYGDGMNVRSWIYVDDHSEALFALVERGKIGEVYNIGGMREAEIPNIEVARKIISTLGCKEDLIQLVKDRPAHDRRYSVDIGKIKKEVGWSPKVSFNEGIVRTVDWYKSNEGWWRRIKSGEYLKYYEQNYSNR